MTEDGHMPYRGMGIVRLCLWTIAAAVCLIFMAGCGKETSEAETAVPGVTAPRPAAPAETGARRGNPDPNAAANAAAFAAARKKAEGK